MFDENNNTNYEPQGEPNTPPEEPVLENLFAAEDAELILIKKQKRQIKATALLLGVPLILLTFIPQVWRYVYIFITVRVIGMTPQAAGELLANAGVQHILQIVLSSCMFLIPFAIAVKCTGERIDNILQFGRAKKGSFWPFVFFGVGFCIFANVAASQVSAIFESFDVEYNYSQGPDPLGPWGFALAFISTAIVPAIVEEFACRGVILGLLKRFGEGFAVITSSIIFGLMHGNFDQIPFAIVVGLVLGYIYIKTESIWPCILVHCINNAASVIFSNLIGVVGIEIGNILYIIYLVAGMLLAILGVFMLHRSGIEDYSLNPPEQNLVKAKQKYIWFFTSILIVIFVLYNLFEAMMYFPFFRNFITLILNLIF